MVLYHKLMFLIIYNFSLQGFYNLNMIGSNVSKSITYLSSHPMMIWAYPFHYNMATYFGTSSFLAPLKRVINNPLGYEVSYPFQNT